MEFTTYVEKDLVRGDIVMIDGYRAAITDIVSKGDSHRRAFDTEWHYVYNETRPGYPLGGFTTTRPARAVHRFLLSEEHSGCATCNLLATSAVHFPTRAADPEWLAAQAEIRTKDLIGRGLWPNPDQCNPEARWWPLAPVDDTLQRGVFSLAMQLQEQVRNLEREAEEARKRYQEIAGMSMRFEGALRWIVDQDSDLIPAQDLAMIRWVLDGTEPT